MSWGKWPRTGYVSGEVLAEHAQLGIELVGPRVSGGGMAAPDRLWIERGRRSIGTSSRCVVGKRHLSQNWCPGRHTQGEEVIRVSCSAVTCHACPVKELRTKREKNKGRILTLSPQPVHEDRQRRRIEQGTPPFQQRYALAGRYRRESF
jgi:hypothetical protein